jgi:hypothetical protein
VAPTDHLASDAIYSQLMQSRQMIEPLAVRFGGDHLTREPLEHLEAEGFTVEKVARSRLGIVELVRARKP